MKKVISMLVVMIMLISSFGAFSVSAAEPETYPKTLFYDFNTYKGDSYTWGTNIGKWGDKRWESSGGSGAYQFDDGHSYVYKFKATNAAPRLNLDEKVTGGKYLIAFDWYIEKGNTPRVILRLRDENSNSSSIGEIRGIAQDQNIESNMEKVVEEKLNEFPDKEQYYKKVNVANFKQIILFTIDNNGKIFIQPKKRNKYYTFVESGYKGGKNW